MTVDELAQLIACAMARQEGFFLPSSVQHERRNPGNIMDVAYYKATKQFRLQTYSTYTDGWNALADHVRRFLLNKRLTLVEYIGGQRDSAGAVVPNGYPGYAPAGHGSNKPRIYAENIGKWCNLPINQPATETWLQMARATEKLPTFGAGAESAKAPSVPAKG